MRQPSVHKGINARGRHSDGQGFTIVELLIVVVVIAILAAITVVTFSGFQLRANNAAIVDGASKTLRMIQAYIAANGVYPATTSACVTTSVGCQVAAGFPASTNPTFDANVATVGSLPRSVPVNSAVSFGITYAYGPRTMNGVQQPAVIVYFLQGTNQQCGVSGVATEVGGNVNVLVTSSSGYTIGNDGGNTRCRVSIPGPSV